MSYLVLARKWRPQSFDQVAGQGAVVRTLQNAISKKRVAHAMIFSGVRGVGKTTLARIMAKAINCEGKAPRPCNQCSSCQEITAGNSMDLHEIDGASNRGIQEIRELKENIRFQPAKSRYKIIIIDEVHMLTTEAFNALLKTLEEPPEHVFFMFATTELHKVPVTILSRCQRYELKRVSFADLVTLFKRIAHEEKVDISESALEVIAREAGGSVRDGLSLLDQIFSFAGEKIEREDVTEVLGVAGGHVIGEIASGLLQKNLGRCLELLGKSYGRGIDLKRFATELLTYFRSMVIVKVSNGPVEDLLDVADQELQALKETAEHYSAETLTNALNGLLSGVEEMQYSSNPKLVLEVAFMKIIAAGDVVSTATLLERLLSLSLNATAADDNIPTISGTAEKIVVPETSSKPKEKILTQEKIVDEISPEPVKELEKKSKTPPPVESRRQTPSEKKQDDPASSVAAVNIRVNAKEVRKHWAGFIAHVKDRKPWMAHALSLCKSARENGHELILKYDEASECKVLEGKENIKLLNEFCLDFFQKDLRVVLEAKIGKAIRNADGEEQNLPQEERKALASDPLVQLTTEILGGQVSGIRTGPRSR